MCDACADHTLKVEELIRRLEGLAREAGEGIYADRLLRAARDLEATTAGARTCSCASADVVWDDEAPQAALPAAG
ncbi:MAG TPA: hypothetical protein VHA10_07005 [Hypericibacter adhaerens]|uniref:hypothetical protein n=1 Tax=Hypericibacter adhaerens TaxID=2602016 RepID=UPI002BE145DB|nr:hypothetical protein [Hypericibacter adhaerens]HWA42941.1 hypothetical protein [Hypericibacter adhaerens]